jgi:hypothetical protein
VTLLNIAYAFGEEAIEPVRALYLCAPAEPETTAEKRRRLIRELAALIVTRTNSPRSHGNWRGK